MSYRETERIALSDEMKKLVRSTIELLMFAQEVDFSTICARYDGKFAKHRTICKEDGILVYPGELEKIFPDETKQTREHCVGLVEGYVRLINEKLDKPLPGEVGERIVEKLIENGHYGLLSHLHEVNHLWTHRRLHWESSSWAHTRSLVVSLETLAKEWFGGRKMSGALAKAFGRDYAKLCKRLNVGNSDAKNLEEYNNKMDLIIRGSEEEPFALCGCHLMAVQTTRNYLSHWVETSEDMLYRKYAFLHDSIVFTLISLYVKYVKLQHRDL